MKTIIEFYLDNVIFECVIANTVEERKNIIKRYKEWKQGNIISMTDFMNEKYPTINDDVYSCSEEALECVNGKIIKINL